MDRKIRKKPTKKRKKFWIILACYVIVFVLTSIVTTATLSWFNSDTWQTQDMYMGGPVYIDFTDHEGNKTSGAGKMVYHNPPGWAKLYPGMNIHFEASARIKGVSYEHTLPNGDEFTSTATTAVLRAKIRLTVTDENGENADSEQMQEIYNLIWPQLKANAQDITDKEGVWIFEQLNLDVDEENYFYYVEKNQSGTAIEDMKLVEVGKGAEDDQISFLDDTVVTTPPVVVVNEHADCILTFTVIFEAVQAFFPYTSDDLGEPYQGDTAGRSDVVTEQDLGLGKPLIIKNSRKLFEESIWTE